MNIASGTRLGPYEMVAPIGAGGMGEVWRARDTRLDRSVAIKVLPHELAGNAQFKLRFEREAKAISQLNHPNICTLHDVGEEQGTSYLVMELLHGETLGDRLANGPLPLAEVLRYGIQIAEGLDRAHRAGIVHRDLKPGNIMITKSGAKLLDFGLAKASGAQVMTAVPADGETEMRGSGGSRAPLTAEGTIIGTFQYMAPEQLEGLPADARTDIFALGAVLYEMATGRRAFDGKTRTSLIAAIVSAQPPPITNVQPLAPTSVDHVIATCLAKDPDARWQSAHDVAQELRWIQTSDAMPAVSPTGSRRWMAAAALAIVTAAILAALYARERWRPQLAVSFSIMPPRGYSFGAPRIAPDGSALTFVGTNEGGDQGIWVRHVASANATKILESATLRPGNLFWSPDSMWIGFFDHNNIMKVPVQGGSPEMICSGCVTYGAGAAWGKSRMILFTPKWGEGMFRVPASGGTAVRVTALDTKRRENLNGWPQFADDDGDRFVYLIRTVADEKSAIYGGSLSGNGKTFLTSADSLVGVWTKHLLFVRDGVMYGQRFDAARMRLTGEPRKIIDDAYYDEDSAHSFASVASNGALLYQPSSNSEWKVEVGWYDRGGRLLEKLFDDTSITLMSLSPDDSKVALLKLEPKKGANDVYVFEVARGVRSKVTGGLANHLKLVWSPAGDRVFFAADGDGLYEIYAQPDDGATPPQAIWKGGDDKHPLTISPDGQTLLATVYSAKTKSDIWSVPLSGQGKPSPFIATGETDGEAAFSPDGKWIAYSSSQSGRSEVYARAFPLGRSVQVSVDGGGSPSWSPDGSEIYFFTRDANVVAAPFRATGIAPLPGKPQLLFHLPRTMSSFQPSHKVGRFLGSVRSNPQESIGIINYTSGWTDKLDD